MTFCDAIWPFRERLQILLIPIQESVQKWWVAGQFLWVKSSVYISKNVSILTAVIGINCTQ